MAALHNSFICVTLDCQTLQRKKSGRLVTGPIWEGACSANPRTSLAETGILPERSMLVAVGRLVGRSKVIQPADMQAQAQML